MKKLPLLILGALIGAFATYYFCPRSEASADAEEYVAIVKPKGLITPEQAKVLDTTYNSRYKLISDSIVTRKGGDNRSVWFSKNDLENYRNSDLFKETWKQTKTYFNDKPQAWSVDKKVSLQ